jgi:hypothetical protein
LFAVFAVVAVVLEKNLLGGILALVQWVGWSGALGVPPLGLFRVIIFKH